MWERGADLWWVSSVVIEHSNYHSGRRIIVVFDPNLVKHFSAENKKMLLNVLAISTLLLVVVYGNNDKFEAKFLVSVNATWSGPKGY
jgi:hypothetical protein